MTEKIKYSVSRSAKYLGVSRVTLYNWQTKGYITIWHRFDPDEVYIYKDDLDALMKRPEYKSRRK